MNSKMTTNSQVSTTEPKKKPTQNELSKQLEQNKETRIQKNEERLKNLWDNFKHSNIWIIGVPEGEKEEQETENLFEKIMKQNFPNLAKEIDS